MSTSKIAIIGGSSLVRLHQLQIERQEPVSTPYGEPETPMVFGQFAGQPIIFLNRRGDRRIPPHRINYRANIWALHEVGVEKIIAVAGMGGIRADMRPGTLTVPDQLIDYTYGRNYTYYEDCEVPVEQIDFTYPFSENIRQAILKAGLSLDLLISDEATVAVSQGPRFETLAEIKRFERDACDLVSMTPIPEVVLARELGMEYATLGLVTGKAAGRRSRVQDDQDNEQLVQKSYRALQKLLVASVQHLA